MALLADVLDLLLARACVGCEDPGSSLCEQCASTLMPVPIGIPGLAVGPTPVVAGLPYAGLARSVVIAHKERNERSLTPTLGLLLAAAVRRLPMQAALVPVPSHPHSLRARGRDTVREIADAAARRLDLPVEQVLARAPGGRQKQRSGRERRDMQAMAPVTIRRRPMTTAAILVDDVIATGSTMARCRDALEATGVRVVGMAAVTASLLDIPATRGGLSV